MTRGLGRRPASRARPRVVGADEGRIFEATVRFADGGRLDAMREVGLAPGGVMDKSNVPSPISLNWDGCRESWPLPGAAVAPMAAGAIAPDTMFNWLSWTAIISPVSWEMDREPLDSGNQGMETLARAQVGYF